MWPASTTFRTRTCAAATTPGTRTGCQSVQTCSSPSNSTVAFAADPGLSKTDLQPASARANNGFAQRFWILAVKLGGQSAARGTLPQLRAGTDPAAVGGTLYAPRWISVGAPVVRGVSKRIADPAQLVRLWELCECETGITLESVLAAL